MNKNVLIGLGVVGGFVVWASSKKAMASTKGVSMEAGKEPHLYGAPMALSPHFNLSEFLRSSSMPGIATYKLTKSELDIVKSLVTELLEPLRAKYGTVYVTNGGRPLGVVTGEAQQIKNLKGQTVTLPAGSNVDDALRAKGYAPSATSDHHNFAAADIVLSSADAFKKAYADLQAHPLTRQVLLYVDDKGKPAHLHVAIVYPGHGKLKAPLYAFTRPEAGGVS